MIDLGSDLHSRLAYLQKNCPAWLQDLQVPLCYPSSAQGEMELPRPHCRSNYRLAWQRIFHKRHGEQYYPCLGTMRSRTVAQSRVSRLGVLSAVVPSYSSVQSDPERAGRASE